MRKSGKAVRTEKAALCARRPFIRDHLRLEAALSVAAAFVGAVMLRSPLDQSLPSRKRASSKEARDLSPIAAPCAGNAAASARFLCRCTAEWTALTDFGTGRRLRRRPPRSSEFVPAVIARRRRTAMSLEGAGQFLAERARWRLYRRRDHGGGAKGRLRLAEIADRRGYGR